MSHPSAVSGAFGLPFAEQVAFFRAKLGNLVPTQRWDDMTGAAHDTGFMVAGAAEADLLTDLAAAVDKAISEGKGIEEFRKDFRSIVRRNGWTGWAGEGSVGGEAWRVKTILRTNSYTSYSAGRLAQLREAGYPFWVYRHGGSREPRPEHLDLDGLILAADHPFWSKWYPPSDWGCSCYVVGARSERGAKRLGGDPSKTLPANWNRIDPKTGEPAGIGKGWGYAPGATVDQAVRAAAGKVGAWEHQIAKAYMHSLPATSADALSDAYRALPSTADDVRRYAQRVQTPNEDLAPLPPVRTLGLVRSDQRARIEALTGHEIDGYDFSLDVSAVGHVFSRHGDDAAQRRQGQRGVTPADFALLPRVLSEPDDLKRGTSAMGEPAVEFVKRLGADTVHAIMVVRGKKRRTVSLKTLYIGIGK